MNTYCYLFSSWIRTIVYHERKFTCSQKKRRGVARASITKLSNKVAELETLTSNPDTLIIAQSLVGRLKDLNTEFKTHHLAIVDLIDDEEELSTERDALDHHVEIEAHLQRLISNLASASRIDSKRTVLKRLTQVKENYGSLGNP